MKNFSASDLKTILHSKRANMYFLEHCKVLQKDGRVVYLSSESKQKQYWNIPIANTTVILLGTGTSITQLAVRMLSQAGVLIGFTGSGGTPLYASSEVEWLNSQSEYRPTEYLQKWVQFWFDDTKRLIIAKKFQEARLNYLSHTWQNDRELKIEGIETSNEIIKTSITEFKLKNSNAKTVTELLSIEAQFAKQLYRFCSQAVQIKSFSRNHKEQDLSNQFLNHGNYLAYGLAASTLWVLGIPHGLAVMHGKTRRGALVFDVADLIKDTLILPWAFIGAKNKWTEKNFRQKCLQNFIDHKSMDFMFETVKDAALTTWSDQP